MKVQAAVMRSRDGEFVLEPVELGEPGPARSSSGSPPRGSATVTSCTGA
jgi:hypothetical protein